MEKIVKQFNDIATYSSADKTAVSVRDGVLEYLGIELGMEPKEKVFTVYRTPATIANVALAMTGIPVTNEHVSLEYPAPDTGSAVLQCKVIDQIDASTSATLAIKNNLKIGDELVGVLSEKRELSLGYFATLVPHDKFDFEQIDIMPHHLAVVDAGRCGPLCSFIDRKTEKKMADEDKEPEVSLEQIVTIATPLPEAMKKMPLDKLKEIVPILMEVINYAKEQDQLTKEEVTDEKQEPEEKEEMKDESMKEDDKKFSDSDVKALVREFADAEVKRYSSVVDKARNFLDSDYCFSDKTANQLMRDSLATQSTEEFADEQLEVAFKLLRKSEVDYSKFGDSKEESSLDSRIKKYLEI